MAQQTAVEWLEEIYKNCNKYEESISVSDWEQAKAMEKEQIIEAAADHCYPTYELAKIDAEQYYNKTFKSE